MIKSKMDHFYLVITAQGSSFVHAESNTLDGAQDLLKEHFLAYGGPIANVEVYKCPLSCQKSSLIEKMEEGDLLSWNMHLLSFRIFDTK
jgi:hypothetical protein